MLTDKEKSGFISDNIITLTDEERGLVDKVFEKIKTISSLSYDRISRKLIDLERVAKSISQYPSIKESSILAGNKRDAQSLIDSLCAVKVDSRLLSLPTKTVLGKAYLVAKFHTFVAFTKVSQKLELDKELLSALQKASNNVLFTIMAEDVYFSLLEYKDLSFNIREEIASSLVGLWESRLDINAKQFSSVLVAIWEARSKIAPVFGTMLGTAEFFSFSSYVGTKWALFISKKLIIKEIMQALEEFLFGISYEEIAFVREKLKKERLDSVSRDEVFNMLGREDSFKESDMRSFYASYSERRHNAEARKRLQAEGPKNILEDYCVRSIFEEKDFWNEKK